MTVEEKREIINGYCKRTLYKLGCKECALNHHAWCPGEVIRDCSEPALNDALELIGYEHLCEANKKPRLAEVLGVEAGEVFYISDYPSDYGPVAVDGDGKLRRVRSDSGRGHKVGANALYHLIAHPECVSRLPRWTEQEVKDAIAIRRILPEARDIDRITETLMIVRDKDGFCLFALQKDMFPNIKKGQTVKLADIIGAEEDT